MANETVRVSRPSTQRGRRFLKERDAKLVENDKTTLFIRGGNASASISSVLHDLHAIKKPFGVFMKKKNMLRPFEDETPIESFSQKLDASLFVFGSHSKKRPNNLIIGRLFNGSVLDMVELSTLSYTAIADFKTAVPPLGMKPCVVFIGEQFDTNPDLIRLKSLLLDLFRGPNISQISLNGIQSLICFSMTNDGLLHFRNYRIQMKKSDSKIPRVELDECGPRLNFQIGRNKFASDDHFNHACKQPEATKVQKKKNISRDVFGSKLGRIHMRHQDLAGLQTRKLRGLKRSSGDGPSQMKLSKLSAAE